MGLREVNEHVPELIMVKAGVSGNISIQYTLLS